MMEDKGVYSAMHKGETRRTLCKIIFSDSLSPKLRFYANAVLV